MQRHGQSQGHQVGRSFRSRGLPAGSFKCERFVKSSLASRMVGFISGGKDSSLPPSRASRLTLTSFSCTGYQRGYSGLGRGREFNTLCGVGMCDYPYLAIFELEGEDDLVAIYLFLYDLGSNPALGGIGLPGSCTNIIIRGHVL